MNAWTAMFGLVCAAMLTSCTTTQSITMTNDPYLWLEDVDGTRALEWVRAENQRTVDELASNVTFKGLEASIRTILDSDARIPSVEKIGSFYYNFWRDKQNPRGVWRRTTLDEYRKPTPAWETVLDIDALNLAEGKAWVWSGAKCLMPDHRRCLIALSPGGTDATVTREFDLVDKAWVTGGFESPLAKGQLAWIDRDTVYAFTDFGAGSQTASGYPRIAKRWRRGTPLSRAELVYEGQADDLYISAQRDFTPGFERDFVHRALAFYSDEMLWVTGDGSLKKVPVPDSSIKAMHREWLLITLRDPWTVGAQTHPAGTLLATRFNEFMQGAGMFDVLYAPTPSTSLSGMIGTRQHLVLNVLDDVKSTLRVWTATEHGWKMSTIEGLPRLGQINAVAVDPYTSDDVWLNVTDFLTPPSLLMTSLAPSIEGARAATNPQLLKQSPTFFDASTHQVEQHFATSKDGTRVPYFLVMPHGAQRDGSTPTLLYGYGGFEVSELPRYSAGVGKGWIERGGAYALANIRGGGEYGPRWHQAALKANRHRAIEDFAAVAQDLVARKVTAPHRLGVRGGSNGGLLTGNMLTQHPTLVGAVSIEVPLLDMRRYHRLLAGASWMAEYGDPDKPDEWAFIQTFSPYHLFDPARTYPPTLLLTSTKDDRVHPGHARKMAALMRAANKNVRYYENIEGGHGGAADNGQAAFMAALAYHFLWQSLSR